MLLPASNLPTNRDPARVLGLFSATSIVIGAIIGVGIFLSPSGVARLTGSESLALWAWAIAGFIALCGALAFAELGGMYNRSGAQYEIIRDSTGPAPAFVFVFCNATAIQPGTMGIIAVICANNLAVAAGREPPQGLWLMTLASTLIVLLAIANIIGVRWGSGVQNLTVISKVATLLAVTALAAFFAPGDAIIATTAASVPTLSPVQGVMAALVPALFAYGGWQQALWIAGEIRQPQRNLPRAIVGGVLIVIAVYLLANWSYLHLLGVDRVAASSTVASDAVSVVMPEVGRRIIAAAVAVSAFGVLNAQLLAGPRLVFGMACDGRFFAPFGRLHARCGTPIAAILLLTIMSLVILAFAMIFAEDKPIDQLLNGTMFIDVIFFAMTGAALIILRRKRPGVARPVRVPGYPIVPLLFVLGELGALVGALLDPSVRGAAYIGAAWIAAAAIVYAIWFRNPRKSAWSGDPPSNRRFSRFETRRRYAWILTMTRRNVLLVCIAGAGVSAAAVAIPPVRRLFHPLLVRLRGRSTTADRVREFEPRVKPLWEKRCRAANVPYPPSELMLVAFKQEHRLLAYATDAAGGNLLLHEWPILGASGRPGPKLKEGDRQVPEGDYRINLLNPDSRFHVSLRVNYPNDFDVAAALQDGRENLGGDIYIHGGSSSIGCLAIGDAAIEELFTLVADCGLDKTRIIIAPWDLRNQAPPPIESTPWQATLYERLQDELQRLPID